MSEIRVCDESQIAISVCVVVYKTERGLLDRCLKSISRAAEHSRISVEILIADNSPDEVLRQDFSPEVDKWVAMPQNVGFAVACNALIRQARGQNVLFLNPDATLDISALNELMIAVDSDSKPALFCGWLTIGERVQVDAFMHWWSSSGRLLRKNRYRRKLERASTQARVPVQKVSGGALWGRRDHLTKLGPFDESFFLYGEDADLSVRAVRAGYSLFAVPKMQVAHVGASSQTSSGLLVEQARADAGIRVAAYHLPYIVSILLRLEFLTATMVGALPGLGRSSATTSARLGRLGQIRRWGFSRTVSRFEPSTK